MGLTNDYGPALACRTRAEAKRFTEARVKAIIAPRGKKFNHRGAVTAAQARRIVRANVATLALLELAEGEAARVVRLFGAPAPLPALPTDRGTSFWRPSRTEGVDKSALGQRPLKGG